MTTYAETVDDALWAFDDEKSHVASNGKVPDQRQDTVEWDTPTPLGPPPPPPFPVDALGPTLARSARAVAEQHQCPVDLPGVLTLPALASAVGKGARAVVIETWEEPLNLYVASALAPGENKSPVLRLVYGPLREREDELAKEAAPGISDRRNEREIAEGRLAKAKKDAVAADGSTDSMANVSGAQAALDKLPLLVAPRVFVDDITPEALVQVLAEQEGCTTLMSSEGGIFATLAGRYSQNVPNVDAVLKAHDGREPIRVSRKNAPDINVEVPCLTFALAIQPSVLVELGGKAEFRDRGLVARFLYSIPTSLVGSRHMRVDESDISDSTAAFTDFADCLASAHRKFGAYRDVVQKIYLESPSLSIFSDWREYLESQRGPGGAHSAMAGWSNKIDSHTVRIAALLAIADSSAGLTVLKVPKVTPDHMCRAIEIMRYFIEHARAAFDLMCADEATTAAGSLLKWAIGSQKTAFTLNEAKDHLHGQTLLKSAEQRTAAANVLVEYGWLRQGPSPAPTGGRPSAAVYLLNPCARPARVA
jgi:replicative DNA helicase